MHLRKSKARIRLDEMPMRCQSTDNPLINHDLQPQQLGFLVPIERTIHSLGTLKAKTVQDFRYVGNANTGFRVKGELATIC